MSQYPGPVPVEDLHRWKTEATQRLLGYTIALTEDEWHQPAQLPGWSRAHVATHLARNADYFRSVLNASLAGGPQPELPSVAERRHQLERGADRSGLELQIDLDAASGALQNAIESVTDWTPSIILDAVELPLSALPLARLHEVKLHLLDLGCGYTPDSVPGEPAAWLLRWALFRLRNADLPALQLTSNTLSTRIGSQSDLPLHVEANDANLWAWLTGRVGPEAVSGAEGLELPKLS